MTITLDIDFKSLSNSDLGISKSKVIFTDLILLKSTSCPSTTILFFFFAIIMLLSFANVSQIFGNRYDTEC